MRRHLAAARRILRRYLQGTPMPLDLVQCTCGAHHRLYLCPACGLNRSKIAGGVIAGGAIAASTETRPAPQRPAGLTANACRICERRRTGPICQHCDQGPLPCDDTGCLACRTVANGLAITEKAHQQVTPVPTRAFLASR